MRRQAFGLIVVAASVFAAAAASAQPLKARVDGAAAHRYVTTLASPEWQGRRTLTPGFDLAADWAAARLREWNLQPAGESGTFFQTVPIVGPRSDFAWTTGMPALVIGGRAFSFKEGEFIVDKASTPATDLTAEAVFVGYGISAPDRGLDEYAGIDVTGKIVFVLRGSPKDAPPDLTDFPPDSAADVGPAGGVDHRVDGRGEGDDRLPQGGSSRRALRGRSRIVAHPGVAGVEATGLAVHPEVPRHRGDGPSDPAHGDAARRGRVSGRLCGPHQPPAPTGPAEEGAVTAYGRARPREGLRPGDALRGVVRQQQVAQRPGEDRGDRPGAQTPGRRGRRAHRPSRVQGRPGAPGRGRQRVGLGRPARGGPDARRVGLQATPYRSSSRCGAARRRATTAPGGSRPLRPTA